MRTLTARRLTREVFAEFGDVLDTNGANHYKINGGMTERFHALATAQATGADASVILSIFRGQPYAPPLTISMVERHPFGSQAFMPLSPAPFLVAVCHDGPDGPGEPHVFMTQPGQGVNYPANLWHAVLTPIGAAQDFLVVDRAGGGVNVEEHHFAKPYEIHLPQEFLA